MSECVPAMPTSSCRVSCALKYGAPRSAVGSGRVIDVAYACVELLLRATRPLWLMPHGMTHARGAHEGRRGVTGHGGRVSGRGAEVKTGRATTRAPCPQPSPCDWQPEEIVPDRHRVGLVGRMGRIEPGLAAEVHRQTDTEMASRNISGGLVPPLTPRTESRHSSPASPRAETRALHPPPHRTSPSRSRGTRSASCSTPKRTPRP